MSDQAKCAATQAREANISEIIAAYEKYKTSPTAVVEAIKQTLSNSAKYTERWLAEHDAKVLTDVADEILETVSHSDVDNHDFENGKEDAAQQIKIKVSEIRSNGK